MTSSKLVIVFDYDWSLINTNSDIHVFEQLAPEVLKFISQKANTEPDSWTSIIDQALVQMQTNFSVSTDQIRECLAHVPVLAGMVAAVKEAAESGLAEVHIVSDASEFFIQAFLDKKGLGQYIKSVKTNASWTCPEKGILRVRPYHPQEEPHGCSLCPPNLCKGRVLERDMGILGPESARIVYIGDGGGDFCAAVRLRPSDLLLVRNDPSVPSARGLVKRIEREKEQTPVSAEVREWTTGLQVLEAIREAIAIEAHKK
uniref:Uncharacterized protein n=1 Tax=Chromera velia CCMP2878 TaxID=1169474 RepID=A0A0G4FN04_9ALVE|eukprot:Cvel_17672.t1-p1 / transcript=Cvel_17672.t1 / gene=Cvel_17672 / organism=Chromera_velia_CCMP2878 / gene_product=Inorganic pyrophosphatase 3, putative / transcript_product=Inorganic pyrophosphatase 3, putative / location=Cvel_scaffold1424:35436-36206(-) / protein_length=257 / sequence_SO=supercontig / SO=protein_coding / is_pseudo=false